MKGEINPTKPGWETKPTKGTIKNVPIYCVKGLNNISYVVTGKELRKSVLH